MVGMVERPRPIISVRFPPFLFRAMVSCNHSASCQSQSLCMHARVLGSPFALLATLNPGCIIRDRLPGYNGWRVWCARHTHTHTYATAQTPGRCANFAKPHFHAAKSKCNDVACRILRPSAKLAGIRAHRGRNHCTCGMGMLHQFYDMLHFHREATLAMVKGKGRELLCVFVRKVIKRDARKSFLD